jgi:hypothetical protein
VFFFGIGICGVFVVIVLLALLTRAVPSLLEEQQLIALPAQFLIYLFLYLALWGIIRVKYDRPVWISLGWLPSRVPAWLAVLSGCALSFAIGLLGSALRTPQIKSPFDRFMHAPVWMVMFGIFAVLLGPVFEEVVFRGFIQPLLTRDLGSIAGILMTAGAFGLLHGPEYSGSWQYVVLITFAGACFGVIRYWSGSLTPAILMHAGFNAVFFVAALAQTQAKK